MGQPHIHILGISGSLRAGSFNTALLRNALDMLPEDASLEIADLSGIPLFNQDAENDPPEAVREFRARIAGGRFGTVRAQLHFRQIATYLNVQLVQKPELMIALAQ